MENSIHTGDSQELSIKAKELFSTDRIKVKAGQSYEVTCGKEQRWTDWFIPSDAEGYINPLALLIGMRVPKTNCFCLCVAYNDSLPGAFAIGFKNKVRVKEDGNISFFANDSEGYYKNNKGSVKITVTRII